MTGAIVVKRRRPILLDDGMLERKDTYLLLGTLVLLATLSSLNSLPSQLFRYDTAHPWGNFIGATALGFVVAIPVALIVLGLWLALGAMRRRVGIPMLAGEPSRSASNDMLIAGLGLGGAIFAMTQFDALVPRGGMPRTPTTVLNEMSPMLAGLVDIPVNALMIVAMVGIPFLVVAGLTRRWSLRALMAVAIAAVLSALAWSLPASDLDPARVAVVIVAVAMVSLAVVLWGSLAAWSWLVAALAYQSLGGLRNAAYGAVWQERGAGALTLIAASALIVLIVRRTALRRQAP